MPGALTSEGPKTRRQPPLHFGFTEHLFGGQPANLGRACDSHPDLAALEPDGDAVAVMAALERRPCPARARGVLRVGNFRHWSNGLRRRVGGALPDGSLRGAYVHLQPPCVAHAAGARRDGSGDQSEEEVRIYIFTAVQTRGLFSDDSGPSLHDRHGETGRRGQKNHDLVACK